MGFKKEYLEEAVNTILRINPSLDKDDVEDAVKRIMKSTLKDPSIELDNNVTGENRMTTLTGFCAFIEKRNPVISGNATLYCQPEELQSPTSNMLRALKKERKEVKHEMFKYNPFSDEYADLDLDQGNKKVIMNAEYGGSGAPTAAFYTKYSPAATTLLAQSIITTMAAFFEGFIGNNHKFFHINECMDWMNTVVKKKKDKIHKWIFIPTPKDVIHRIVSHFYMFNINDYKIIESYVNNCSDKERIYLYYANNMNEFIERHPIVINHIRNILISLPILEAVDGKEAPVAFQDKFKADEFNTAADKYNKWLSKEMFLDPYSIPDVIKDDITALRELIIQYVFIEYITPDSIVKLNNHMRNTVLLVDTDSNIINADLFVNFVRKHIFPGESFGRSSLYNDMILVNTLASIVSTCVEKMLDFYGRCHRMNKEARAELAMKNEFLFRRFFIMKTKKRYAASIALREGNIMMPFKLEIKGMDFIKAGVSEVVKKRFTKMLETHILYSEELELHELMKDLKKFENEILHDLKTGGINYLKPQMYKAEGAYKSIKDENGRVIGSKAWSLPVFRGSAVWNELYPDKKINSLDRVKIIKLITTSDSNLSIIKSKYPKEYQMVIDKIYNSNNEEIRKAGLKVICIPSSVKKIPEWIIPLIDFDTIISDVISSFRSVLDALDLEEMYFKTPNGNASITSCLISL